MRTSKTSANGRGGSFPYFGLSANRITGKGVDQIPKLVHEPCVTWPQKGSHRRSRAQLTRHLGASHHPAVAGPSGSMPAGRWAAWKEGRAGECGFGRLSSRIQILSGFLDTQKRQGRRDAVAAEGLRPNNPTLHALSTRVSENARQRSSENARWDWAIPGNSDGTQRQSGARARYLHFGKCALSSSETALLKSAYFLKHSLASRPAARSSSSLLKEVYEVSHGSTPVLH
jgi:hypothetical protein